MLFAYTLLHYLLMPVVVGRLLLRGLRNRDYLERIGERFGRVSPVIADAGVIWIHAVSVGEVQAALPLVRALRSRCPDATLLMTTTTPTGSERVLHLFGDDVRHCYFPYDLPGTIRRFLDRTRPRLVVIMETEFWPNLLRECERRDLPVVLANVRLSERSAAGYRRWPSVVRPMLGRVRAIAAQTPEDAARLVALGADPARVKVTGSTKFDVRVTASVREEGEALRRRFGPGRGVWVAASTHEGEEDLLLEAFSLILAEHVDALLLLVPRHPERFVRVAALCRKRGFSTALRSLQPESCADIDVFIGDTMGELPVFYAASDVAFVGGSLVPTGGHNMLEPAALGVPVVTGPHLFNFAEIGRRLTEVGAVRRVDNVRELGRAVSELMADANLRHAAGEAGRRFVEGNRGSLERLVCVLEPFLPRSQ